MASFLAIYIQEAHARDEWPCGNIGSFCDQPKTLNARAELANELLRRLSSRGCNMQFPLLVDNINNDFQNQYSSWPFRFYILYNNKISLKAQPNLETYLYDLEAIDNWMNSHL